MNIRQRKCTDKLRKDYLRASSGDVEEWWIQSYFRENYKKLGFSNVSGSFAIGPDFMGTYKSRKVPIEIERTYDDYIKHKHAENPRFEDAVLVVLAPIKSSKNYGSELPRAIVHIDLNDFVNWWRPKTIARAKEESIARKIQSIASEFQERYVETCGDVEREMSTCGDCDSCSYFGEGVFNEASTMFQKMALKFITAYNVPITEEFNLDRIKSTDIYEFYNNHIYDYLID